MLRKRYMILLVLMFALGVLSACSSQTLTIGATTEAATAEPTTTTASVSETVAVQVPEATIEQPAKAVAQSPRGGKETSTEGDSQSGELAVEQDNQPTATPAPTDTPEVIACNGTPTPAQAEGPYYTPNTPERANLVEAGMGGTPLLVTGRVLNQACEPIPGAKLDFWQTDDNGEYDNVGYRMRGHQFTDGNGSYTLETILPGVYPGRPPHIHVKVNAPGGPVLTTQIYFEGQPGNESDGLVQPSLIVPLTDVAGGGFAATFNFVLVSEQAAPLLQEYPVPSDSRPHDVAPAPDGSVWYTAQGSGELGRLDPATGETRHIGLGQGSAPIEHPFQLPFAQPASPDTWLMAQPYGNTTGAYRQRFTTYGASGGIHFGLDLAAPCGTEVVAIADGVVFAVDGPFGSPPHNLMIDHPDLGYASMYGHLLEAPDLVPGQRVKQGEVIALTGDSRETCYLRPHLHLEIRDLNHIRKFNPVALIDANWDSLALVGGDGRDFARDLDEPRKWQSLYDQPEAQTAGPILNDFDNPWPLDWEKGAVNTATQASSVQPAAAQQVTVSNTPLRSTPIGGQITAGNCCTQPYWNENSAEVRFIDQPGPDAPLGIWEVDLTRPELEPQLVTERLGVYNPDGTLLAYPDRETGLAVIERLADGQQWALDTQGHRLRFAPDSQHVTWTAYDEDAPSDTRVETMWLANVDGSDARVLLQARRTDAVAWLSADELLMTRRISGGSDQQLFTLSLADGSQTELLQVSRIRGLALSPDRRHMVYYVTFESEADKNGVWLIDLQNPVQPAQKLPFFGTYRWRDNQSLIYIPLDPDTSSHEFYEYNILTKETQPLFPDGTNLTVANNDWQVSPDGRRIVMVAANGMELDGVWVLEMDQN